MKQHSAFLLLTYLLLSTSLYAQESVVPSYRVDKAFERIGINDKLAYQKVICAQQYNAESWESVYVKYYDIIDKSTGKRISRTDVQQIFKSLGLENSIANGRHNAEGHGAMASDSILIIDPFIIINSKTGKVIRYFPEYKLNGLRPIFATEKYFSFRGNENSKGFLSVFDRRNFKEVVRILFDYDETKGGEFKEASPGLYRIEFNTGYLELNAKNLIDSNVKNIISDTTINSRAVTIGKNVIKIVDTGAFNVELCPWYSYSKVFTVNTKTSTVQDFSLPDDEYYIDEIVGFNKRPFSSFIFENNKLKAFSYALDEHKTFRYYFDSLETISFRAHPKTSYKLTIDKWDGSIKNGDAIEDGNYFLRSSNYLEEGKMITIKDQKIDVQKPYLKRISNDSFYLFKYQGFNAGGSFAMDANCLKIKFFRN